MKKTKRALLTYAAVVLCGLATGCAAAITCLPGEPSLNCCVKKFPLTPSESCGVPAAEAAMLLEAMEIAGEIAAHEASEEEEAASGAPEPPNCGGQNHHIISRRIAKALQRHSTLNGLYEPRDPRFVARARDEQAHCGYQGWHRDVDQEVINWLDQNKTASPEQFEAYLRELYSRSALRWRFPRGF